MGRDKEDRVSKTFTFDRLIFNRWREIMLQCTKLSNRLEHHMTKDIEEFEKKQAVKQNLNNYSIPNRSAIATAVTNSGGSDDIKAEIEKTKPRYKADKISKFDPTEITRSRQLEATKDRIRRDEEFREQERKQREQREQDKNDGILSDNDVPDDPDL